jgi:hypothetical protein
MMAMNVLIRVCMATHYLTFFNPRICGRTDGSQQRLRVPAWRGPFLAFSAEFVSLWEFHFNMEVINET